MKQKLGIACALIHDPQILFMDEPTANLDPEASKTVRDFILDLKKEKRTNFLNTHNLDEAQRICDKIAILNTKSDGNRYSTRIRAIREWKENSHSTRNGNRYDSNCFEETTAW